MTEETKAAKTIREALLEVLSEAGYIQKASRNEAQNYSFASADDVLTKVREAQYRHGVAIVGSHAEVLHYEPATSKSGTEGRRAVVRLRQTYMAPDGEVASFSGVGEGSDYGDKAVMKANTSALKYLLANMLNLSWGDDPEASLSVGPESEKAKKTAETAAAQKQPKARKAPPKTLESILEALAAAKTMEEVDDAKKDVLANKATLGAEGYAEAKAAVVAARDRVGS